MTEAKKIFITGANRGLGYHLTKEALTRGHTVYAGVRESSSHSLLESLEHQYPNRIRRIVIDVANENSIHQACEELKSCTNELDAIINNAAVLVEREKVLEDLDFEKLRFSFDVNTFGPMYIIQQMLPLIYSGKDQTIINISSEAGTILNAFDTNYAYAMSKTALNMFSERLRYYLSNKGIAVYAVHPGWMKTDMGGGDDAPFDPIDTACGIMDIIEKRVTITSKISFINHLGKPMPL
jgi:NAD(P)-dependent dehydrogenase (short-subunit alcohol dehydrogenase family)